MAVIIQRKTELKELEVFEAEAKQRLAAQWTARSSRASSGRSRQVAASSGVEEGKIGSKEGQGVETMTTGRSPTTRYPPVRPAVPASHARGTL